MVQPLISRGYTVITVTHGNIPKYTVSEIVRDLYRAARFTRSHAGDYGIDPDRIGATGESSGGYLAPVGPDEPSVGLNPDNFNDLKRLLTEAQAILKREAAGKP